MNRGMRAGLRASAHTVVGIRLNRGWGAGAPRPASGAAR